MPTLDPKMYSGPMRGPCGDRGDSGGDGIGGDGPCGPTTANAPVTADYGCSLGVTLQGAVDLARRQVHDMGLRPYQVALVWQKKGHRGDWEQVRMLELVPVLVVAMDTLDLELSQAGLRPEGAISLREVSPAQVSEDTLLGHLDGEPWETPEHAHDREFFYEVWLRDRCPPGSVPGWASRWGSRRRRFVIGSVPHLDARNYQWRVGLIDQDVHRSRTGQDQSLDTSQRKFPKIV